MNMFFLEQFYRLALLLLVYAVTSNVGQPMENSTFEREEVLDGKLGDSSNRILESQKPSVIVCAYACHTIESCRSIAFQNSSETCYGYNVTFASTDREKLEDVAGYVILNKIASHSDIVTDTRVNATDCFEIKSKDPQIGTGVYSVQPRGSPKPFDVLCDMYEDGGGWTVFQRRLNGDTLFNRTFLEYENGFGSLYGDFWMGLSKLHRMTYNTNSSVFILVVDADYKTAHEKVADFYIDNGPGYTFHVGDVLDLQGYKYDIEKWWYVPSVTDLINGKNFSTYDFGPMMTNLAIEGRYGKAGWWYHRDLNLFLPNGIYDTPGTVDNINNAIIDVWHKHYLDNISSVCWSYGILEGHRRYPLPIFNAFRSVYKHDRRVRGKSALYSLFYKF